jgi:hypothetical protein
MCILPPEAYLRATESYETPHLLTTQSSKLDTLESYGWTVIRVRLSEWISLSKEKKQTLINSYLTESPKSKRGRRIKQSK